MTTKRLTFAILALVLTIFACVWIGRQMQTSAHQRTLDAHLLSAVHFNDVPATARLLDAGANPNARPDYSLPIGRRLALALRYPQMRRTLLDPRFRPPSFQPNALWDARVSHQNDMAALLISRGANPNVSAAGVPPLIDIVLQNDTPMLKTFLIGGAKVNAADGHSMTALMYAVSRGRMRDVRLLLDRGASVNLKNKAGKTALTLAEENKRADAVKLLRAAGGTH